MCTIRFRLIRWQLATMRRGRDMWQPLSPFYFLLLALLGGSAVVIVRKKFLCQKKNPHLRLALLALLGWVLVVLDQSTGQQWNSLIAFIQPATGPALSLMHGILCRSTAEMEASQGANLLFGVERAPLLAAWSTLVLSSLLVAAVLLLFGHKTYPHPQARSVQEQFPLASASTPAWILGLSSAVAPLLTPPIVDPLILLSGYMLIGSVVFSQPQSFDFTVLRSRVIDALESGILIVDDKGRLLDANPSAVSLLNLPPDFFGRSSEEIFGCPKITALLKDRTWGDPQSVATVVTTKESISQMVDLRFIRLPGTHATDPFTIVLCRDITAERQREELLRETEGLTGQLVHHSPLGILFLQAQQREDLLITGSNPAAGALLDVAAQTLPGLSLSAAAPAIFHRDLIERLRAVAAFGVTCETEQVLRREEQISRAIEIRGFQIGPDRAVVQMRDITLRKKAEAALDRSLRFQSLLMQISSNLINMPSFRLDPTIQEALQAVGTFCDVDRAYMFRMDMERATLTNSHEWCAPGILPEIDNLRDIPFEAIPQFVRFIIAGRIVNIPKVDALDPADPFRKMVAAQGIKTLLCVPLHFLGTCLGVIGFDCVRKEREWDEQSILLLRTLAELLSNALMRARAEEEMHAEHERNLQLERQLFHAQKLESLGVLAGGIAHDFNNLLTAMLGNLSLAHAHIEKPEKLVPFLCNAEKAAQRASDLTRQMLAYAGKGNYQLVEVNLTSLVRENLSIVVSSLPKSITVQNALDENLPMTLADVGQVQQVVMNLILNASESFTHNTGCIRISTGSVWAESGLLVQSVIEEKPAPGLFVWVEVVDDGCGMSPDVRARLFEPFFTTKFAGRGLGMSAVLGIVRSHAGAIFVESTPLVGTRIRVLFPAHQQSANPASENQSGLPESALQQAGTILVVDDDSAIRTLCVSFLHQLGYDAIAAEDGLKALEYLSHCAPRVSAVLLDYSMPRLDGGETYRRIAAAHSELPIILTSGFTISEIATQLGVDCWSVIFLQKPFGIEQLRAALRQALSKDLPYGDRFGTVI